MRILTFLPRARQVLARHRCRSCSILFVPKAGMMDYCSQCAAGRELGYALHRYQRAHYRGWWT
jgi:hypothetical protein